MTMEVVDAILIGILFRHGSYQPVNGSAVRLASAPQVQRTLRSPNLLEGFTSACTLLLLSSEGGAVDRVLGRRPADRVSSRSGAGGKARRLVLLRAK